MRYFYPFCFVVIFAVLIAGCKKDNSTKPHSTTPIVATTIAKAPADFRVVGYIQTFEIAEGDVNGFDFTRINYLNITFSDSTADGQLPTVANLDAIITAAHAKGVKVLASIGDASTPMHFYANETSRTNYISALMTSINAHQFDGIDVDLEGDYINKNYEAFIGDLSAAVKLKSKLLTAAIATWESTYFTDKALSYFDILNIMSYDNTGPWDPSDPGPHSPYSMAVSDFDYWSKTRGFAKEKLNIGVPFYGYGFGATAVSTLTYKQITNKYTGAENTDQLTEDNGAILYYNGIPTIKQKTTFAMQNAGGVMIWELMYDATNSKSLLTAVDQTANPDNK